MRPGRGCCTNSHRPTTESSISPGSATAPCSVSASKLIQGEQPFDQTSLLTPTGLLLDPVTDQLYVANEGHNTVVVFNQPQDCKATNPVTNSPPICNIPPDRTIFNTSDIVRSLDAPSSLAIDFSTNQMYVSNLGLFNYFPSLLTFDQAASANGESLIGNYYFSSLLSNSLSFQLNFPESIALDTTR